MALKHGKKLTHAEVKQFYAFLKDKNLTQKDYAEKYRRHPETISRTVNRLTAPDPALRLVLEQDGIVKPL